MLVDLGGSSKDVRFVTKDQAKLVLEIWTTNKEGILFQKQVEVLRTENDYAYINSGLNSSDEILITKLGFIINGMQIRTN